MIIDIHARVAAPVEFYEYFRGFINVSGPAGRAMTHFPLSDERLEETLKGHLAEVAAVGTDLQCIAAESSAIPSAERRAALVMNITRQLNDMVARCVKLHPDRFVGIGSLPLSLSIRPRDCAEEMERCIDELGFVGFQINPDPGEGLAETPHMGEEFWYPLYEKLVQFDAPGLVRPGLARFAREPELGYGCQEETVAAWGILRSPQLFGDFPSLKLIIGHGGGYMPYQFGRGRAFRLNDARRNPAVESFGDSLRRLSFDTVVYDQEALELLFRIAGVDRCLFGSDRPSIASATDPRTGRALNDVRSTIDAISWLTEADRQRIYEENARSLFPRLRPPVAK
jgi:predicted TIM-barrel fold metal-dependent hydrolase